MENWLAKVDEIDVSESLDTDEAVKIITHMKTSYPSPKNDRYRVLCYRFIEQCAGSMLRGAQPSITNPEGQGLWTAEKLVQERLFNDLGQFKKVWEKARRKLKSRIDDIEIKEGDQIKPYPVNLRVGDIRKLDELLKSLNLRSRAELIFYLLERHENFDLQLRAEKLALRKELNEKNKGSKKLNSIRIQNHIRPLEKSVYNVTRVLNSLLSELGEESFDERLDKLNRANSEEESETEAGELVDK